MMINTTLVNNIIESLNYSVTPYILSGLAIILCAIITNIVLKIRKENKEEKQRIKEELENAL